MLEEYTCIWIYTLFPSVIQNCVIPLHIYLKNENVSQNEIRHTWVELVSRLLSVRI